MIKIFRYFVYLIFFSFCLYSCKEKEEIHLITDADYRAKVESQFKQRKKMAAPRATALFDVFNKNLTLPQKEALQFLYAYMPLSDLADYNGDFFLQQVNIALETRELFSWGAQIPEDIFMHFVLPCRVNNENLDSARVVFFEELRDRVINLPDTVAALEVNHWCHEKVSYKGSDSRTSSPLASMKTAFGRCGEESTFAVSALRAVGIPARQVYTPRWAHQDDNHAWVEVYVGGKWHYMGACEPEARLNVGWFDVPAKRAMMMHTKTFGLYNGKEDVVRKEDIYSELNVLPSYTETKRIFVRIVDKENNPVPDVKIQYRLYNYAELYPIATGMTDSLGVNSMVLGLGDICVWASKKGMYDYKVVSVAKSDTITMSLQRKDGEEYVENYDWFVPKEVSVPLLPADLLKANSVRLAYEDSLRNAYTATFMSEEKARDFAKKYQLDEEKTVYFIRESCGNYDEICNFLKYYGSHPCAFYLLESISQKDLRDVKADILQKHLTYTAPQSKLPLAVFKEGILSPRISNENLSDWRSFLQQNMNYDFKEKVREDIDLLVRWVRNNIELDQDNNYYNCPLTPRGVHELRRADRLSRNIYFVAACRAMDIPARIYSATGKVQYYKDKEWKNVDLEISRTETEKGTLILTNSQTNELEPEYYIHYTLQKWNGGAFNTLDYEQSESVAHFPARLLLESGYYLLMTGHRYNDGNVRTKLTFFNLKPGTERTVSVELLPLEERKQILGQIDMKTIIQKMDGSLATLSQLAQNKGLVVAMIDPANEPTRHVLADIPLLKSELEEWGGQLIFLIPDDKVTQAFNSSLYTDLPSRSLFAIDKDRLALKKILKSCGKSDEILPTVAFVTEKGEIVYLSQGYRIGIGENLLKVTKFNTK